MFYSSRLRRLYIDGEGPGCCFVMVFVLLGVIMAGCTGEKVTQSDDPGRYLSQAETSRIVTDDRGFGIKPKYSYIRSYPGGGGIFIIKLVTEDNFTGDVILSMAADPALNARLDKRILNPLSNIAEITVRPTESIEIGTYNIELKAISSASPSNIGRWQTILLEVDVLQWGPAYPQDIIPIRDEFVSWLETEHPELGDFSDRIWFSYMTYPQIWVVEHWTFLDREWEFRLCHHVTIPPYDWSKILLRRRGQWDPALAAMRESDGTIHEIPISDYPIMFGY